MELNRWKTKERERETLVDGSERGGADNEGIAEVVIDFEFVHLIALTKLHNLTGLCGHLLID